MAFGLSISPRPVGFVVSRYPDGLIVTRRTQFRILVALTLGWLVWAGLSFVDRPEPFTLRVVDDVGSPIDQAVVAKGSRQLGLTGADGLVVLDSSDIPVEVSAPGHLPTTLSLPTKGSAMVDAVLKARLLRGRVVDASGRPVADAVVTAGSGAAISDAGGRFTVRGAEPGVVTVERPAWATASLDWAGGPGETEVEMEPLTIKAVHITGEAVEERFDEFVDMAEGTELNALMIDLKEESGLVAYNSEVPLVAQVGADAARFDLGEIVSVARRHDLYLIGRIVAFQDPIAAVHAPEMSVWDTATQAPFESNGQLFLDPTDPDARAYALDLAAEACDMGLDEVQFDYVRFPDTRPDSISFKAGVTADIRTEAIRSFLVEAVSILHPMGCAVAADVFGFVTTAQDDGGIGQNWVDIAAVVDVASPMIYPSHYSAGWYGFDQPGDHPGPVVEQALTDGLSRLPRQVVVRPWLQDFGYDASQVRAQIEMAESHGLGWMLWNAFSNVSTDALSSD
ncbi:putative glycoside hydrolase [soil metagenome]